jgi:hypothetical protein
LGAGHLAKLEPRQSREIGFYVAIRALLENFPDVVTTRTTESSSSGRRPVAPLARSPGPAPDGGTASGGARRHGLPPSPLGRRQANSHGRSRLANPASKKKLRLVKHAVSTLTTSAASRAYPFRSHAYESATDVLMKALTETLMQVPIEALMQVPIEVRMNAISCTPPKPTRFPRAGASAASAASDTRKQAQRRSAAAPQRLAGQGFGGAAPYREERSRRSSRPQRSEIAGINGHL